MQKLKEIDVTLKKNVTMWMNIDDMVSEISQTEQNKYNMISLVCGI